MCFLSLELFFLLLILSCKCHKSLKSWFFLNGLFAVGLVFRLNDRLHLKSVLLNNLVIHIELLFFVDLIAFYSSPLGIGCLRIFFVRLLRFGFWLRCIIFGELLESGILGFFLSNSIVFSIFMVELRFLGFRKCIKSVILTLLFQEYPFRIDILLFLGYLLLFIRLFIDFLSLIHILSIFNLNIMSLLTVPSFYSDNFAV